MKLIALIPNLRAMLLVQHVKFFVHSDLFHSKNQTLFIKILHHIIVTEDDDHIIVTQENSL